MNEHESGLSGDYLNIDNVTKKEILGNNTISNHLINKSLNNEIDVGKKDKFSDYLKQNEQPSEIDTSIENVIDSTQEVIANQPIFTGNYSKRVDNKPEEKQETKINGLAKLNEYLKNLSISKTFSNKNTKVATLIVILAIILVVFLNLSNASNNKAINTSTDKLNFNNVEYVSSSAYIARMEQKLTQVLSSIKGAGKVTVMITLETGPQLKIATSVDERTNTSTTSNGTTSSVTVVENPILVTQNGKTSPLILMEIMPVVKGVVVVAEGATNVKLKMELLQAVQSLLNVPVNNIQIFAGV